VLNDRTRNMNEKGNIAEYVCAGLLEYAMFLEV